MQKTCSTPHAIKKNSGPYPTSLNLSPFVNTMNLKTPTPTKQFTIIGTFPFVPPLQTLLCSQSSISSPSFILSSKRPSFLPSFLRVPRPGAHHHVRAPPPPPPPPPQPLIIIMAPKQIHYYNILSFFTIIFFYSLAMVSGESDAEILLKFKESLENTAVLSNWDNATSPCNASWHGILCEKDRIWAIKLEHAGLGGVIDVETLMQLKDLRSISFMNNDFEGYLPNFTRMGVLKTVYLSNNKFYGDISPTAFYGMKSLKKLHLANNSFTGSIPSTLATLPKLMELMLEDNQFHGEIPRFRQNGLKRFSVSNNDLVGEIPFTLSHFNASSFSGNSDLCGAPLSPCAAREHLSVATIVIVAVLVAAALAALLAVVCILLRRKKNPPTDQPGGASQGGQQRNKDTMAAELDRMERGGGGGGGSSSSPDQNGKQGVRLTFLREGGEKFDMADLLKASAEILGSGAFGSTYKAALNDGNVMVVKRFRHMNNVGKEEFNEHMRRLGRLSHPNVLPIVAFYYRKEEKLLVADYAENFSLAFQLHGNRSVGHPCMDWATRLNIVKGVAKGLQYLYNELPSLTAPHGHLKSSNVLLDGSFRPLLADYGLVPVVNQEHAQDQMISYKSPEYKASRRISKKTDVWSLGILILEILTGRFPSDLLLQQGGGGGGDVDLATWVESVMNGGGGGLEVFDGDMAAGTSHYCKGEMMKLLKVGLSCCHADVDRRPDIKTAVEMIEEVNDKDADDDFYSSYTSETDMRSSRGLSDDFKMINI
ncbi:PREDICTED: pollen receptor-like kinase 1 [Erythranthe guttata]|nr:PREDICTED: pollen receptor-like kinase 1 [Erythranthe guttata]|eukprot:XP_012850189.1 PREDICTED: pollen receptor-like kinase 1 [Erythranthe guttata]